MESLNRSWNLVKISFSILSKDKELLLFPILSLIFSVIIGVIFILLSWPFFTTPEGIDHNSRSPIGFLIMFGLYLIIYFIGIFFNTATVAVVYARLKGSDYTFSQGVSFAISHLPNIFLWSLIASTVGMFLQIIAERTGVLGRIASSLVSIGWSLLTFFVVPVLVLENKSVVSAISRSGEVFKNTWGENFIGQASIGFIFFIFALFGLIPIIIVFSLFGLTAGLITTGIVALYWVFLALITSSLGQIYKTALYFYATTGTVPSGFDESSLKSAFVPKK